MKPAVCHYYGVDFLRFLAASLVVLNHFATYARTLPQVADRPADRAFEFLSSFEGLGAVGVHIFFVISGFVITMSAAHLRGRGGVLRFVLARFWRIFPTLWMSTAIAVLAHWITGADLAFVAERGLKSALLLPVGPYADGVVWTLILEMVFYAGIAVLVWRGKGGFSNAAQWLGMVSSGFILCYVGLHIWRPEVALILSRFPFKLLLLHHGVFFALGMLLWDRLLRQSRARGPVEAICFMGLLLAGFLQIALLSQIPLSKALWACLLFALALVGLLASVKGAAYVPKQKSQRFLGDLSYPLYLNHYTLGMSITWMLSGQSWPAVWHCMAALMCVLVVSMAVLALDRMIRARYQPRGIFKTMVRPPLT